MSRPNLQPFARAFATSLRAKSYQQQLHSAVENVSALLERADRLSYVLAQYVPEPARNAVLATRAFALEVNKIADGGLGPASTASKALRQLSSTMGISTADMKFQFWSDMVGKAFNGTGDVGEPTAFLIRDALRNGINLDVSYFHQFLQTRRRFVAGGGFDTVEDICLYGEGTYLQLNYATQACVLSPLIAPSVIALLELLPSLQSTIADVAAHIGQATAVSSMLLGLTYYALARNRVTVPTDLMTKSELSQELVLRLAQGHLDDPAETKEKLQNVVYETAVTANDHLLAARKKLAAAKEEIAEMARASHSDLVAGHSRRWRGGVPDVVFVPLMAAIPTSLYLERLEKSDFDVFGARMQQKEWRLAWRSFRSYYRRTI